MPRPAAPALARFALTGALFVLPLAAVPVASGPAYAQAASVTEAIRVELGAFTIVIPRIEAAGSSLGASEIRALFDPAGQQPLSARLARFNASTVTIPQLSVEQLTGKDRITTEYRDIRIENLKAGIAGSVRIAGATFRNAATGPEKIEGTLGISTITGMDFTQIARVYGGGSGGGSATPEPRRPLYAESVIDGMTIQLNAGGRVRVGRLTARDARGRVGEGSLLSDLDAILASQTGRKPSDIENLKNLHFSLDILDRFSLAESEIRDIRLEDVVSPDGPVRGGVSRIVFRMPENGENAFEMEGIDFGKSDGSFKMARLAMSGFSLSGLRETLRVETAKPDFDPKKLDPRALIPTLGTIRVEGMEIDAPEQRRGKPTGERLKGQIRSVEIAATEPRNGIPTRIRHSIDGASILIPENTKQEGLQSLLAMGMKAIDLSWGFEIDWIEPAREVAIRNFRLNGVDLGAFTASATLANAGAELFATDKTVQQVAALSMTARALELRYRDNGLVDKFIAHQAKRSGKSPDALRREYATTAALMGPVMLGPSQAARDIASAIGQFIARPGTLTISAKTREPAGLGFMDFMMLGQPAAILEQLEVKAVAE